MSFVIFQWVSDLNYASTGMLDGRFVTVLPSERYAVRKE